ncbi:MAG TPA: anti-sigma factor [Tepidisphaeraceae bacterium]|jgi:anti-sigma-K factor RskA
MTCEDRRDLIFLYAADALDDGEQQELRQHLASGCATCAATLEQAEATIAQIPLALDPVSPPQQARERLMRRVTAEQTRSSGSGWRTAALAACVGLVLGGLMLHFIESARHEKELNDALAMVSQRDQQLGEMKGMMESDKLKLASFAPATEKGPGFGRVLWDQDRGEWHVFVFDLKPPPPGKAYELWFIKADKTMVAAGMFNTDASGKGSMVVKVPENIGPLAAAGVSEEPAAGSPQPTLVRLVGAIQ